MTDNKTIRGILRGSLPYVLLLAGLALTLYATGNANARISAILVGGTLLSVIVFLFARTAISTRAAAPESAGQSYASEKALREGEEQLRMIFENAEDFAIFSTDLSGKVTAWNTGAERMFGWTETEMLGQSGAVIFTPEDRQRGVDSKELQNALEKGFSRDDRWHMRKDGSRIFVSGVVRPLKDPSGKALGFVKITRDITERIKAEQEIIDQKNFSEKIISSLPGVFYVFAHNGRFLRWNENLQNLTGYTNTEVAGMSPLQFIAEEDRESVEAAIRRTLDTGQSSVSAHLQTKDGRRLPFFFSGRRTVYNGVPCVMGTGLDITDRKRVEDELRMVEERLRNYTIELENRVGERTAHLRQSLQSLEGVLYHVAHDLRAPLRAMASFTHLLEEEYGTRLDERGRDYTRRISASSKRMDELVQDLLAYGRLAHMPVPLHEVSLESEINMVVEQFSHEIKTRRASIQIDHPLPPVIGNPGVLHQVLAQLFSNALKFVPPEKPPSIHIRAENGDAVRLWIEDNGIGIKPEHQERIFRIFERLHPVDSYSGTGIGLALVHKGVERMGGSVGVESEPGSGSRFWVQLPKK